MAGNDKRRGGVRKTNKKGMVVGSGGQRRRGLKGKGPTPKAEERVTHPAKKRADQRAKADQQRAKRQASAENAPELVAGRNPVVECVRAGVPATGLYVAQGIDVDDRVTEAVREAKNRGIPVLDVPRVELDRLTSNAMHQGLALQVPPFEYAHPGEVLTAAHDTGLPPLIVALDGVTDPRNLGAVIRSAAAFGAHGVVVPQRRSAGITAVAWRTSAGTAAKLPVAKAVNLTRTLKDYKEAGLMVIGLDADSDIISDELELATGPLVVVVGSEGRGLSRLVRETCDQTVSIPMSAGVESLNASVAAGVVLSEVARRRRIR
ncbi:23S rRNA (guanosine(2251)-2'-O)-methyltransferase RlmB [Saccharopolyspora karakumensis]|uniref:23S rRNA (Guanosine(2251)-2'-O)-methyltransferase RlmB n=1 Tax=Saccharopolyspora karakumensis TaxID=2530386 RepID=A0A4R5BWR1_9PSEU|nr:23S rRNA (guanosine(2251)-2'-O)-methyltransferase RlmB [Saccharopolyspora karakumensis]TDD88742.1 23S rRNA (guanosine(2251)-2'-O)-methyltransferase RlmB [Saccharopolyspora karakumensis]